MTAAQITRLRARIATLPDEGQLRGWWQEVFTHKTRDPFDGEREALLSRARALGLTIRE